MQKERIKIQDDISNPQIKYFMYHKRTNVSVIMEKTIFNERYLIQLNSYADKRKSLIDIFHYYYNSIYELTTSALLKQQNLSSSINFHKFNKFFIYMIDLYLLHELYVETDFKFNEQQQQINLTQIIQSTKVHYQKEHQLQKNIKNLLQKEKNILKNLIQRERQTEPLQPKQQMIKKIKKIKKQLFRNFLRDISDCIQNQQMKSIYIPPFFNKDPNQYIIYLLNTLHDIQFIKKKYKRYKIQEFVTNFQFYFKLCIPYVPQENQESHNLLLIDKYSHSTNKKFVGFDQILINMYDLVKCRKKQKRLIGDIFQLVKNIYNELQRYGRCNEKFYPLLDPKDIIFRQLSLTVTLSYQKPLLQAIGLLKTPFSIEQKICFKNTPGIIDKFASPLQVQPNQNEAYNSNELHGNINNQQIFYDLLNNDNRKNVYFHQSLGWRLLFIASYILHGKQYDKLKGKQFFSLSDYYHFIKQQQSKLQNINSSYVFKSVLNQQFKNKIRKNCQQQSQPQYSLEKGLLFFQELFYPQNSVDQLVQLQNFAKSNKFMKKLRKVRGSFIDTIIKANIYKQVNRTVIYLIRFYIGLYIQVNNIKLIYEYCKLYKQKGLKLLKQLYKILRNIESPNFQIQVCMNKFKQYQSRYKKNENESLQYVFKKCQKYYKKVKGQKGQKGQKGYYELFGQLKGHVISILESVSSKRSTQNDNKQHNTTQQYSLQGLTYFFDHNKDKLDLLPLYINEIAQQQFIQHINQINKPQIVLQSCKIKIMIKLILYMNNSNYITLQSLVLPIVDKQFMKEKDINSKIQMYQYALEILQDQNAQQLANTMFEKPNLL